MKLELEYRDVGAICLLAFALIGITALKSCDLQTKDLERKLYVATNQVKTYYFPIPNNLLTTP